MSIILAPNPRTYTLHVDGTDYGVVRIGSGLFTVAYSDGDKVFLVVKDGCFDKDMMAELYEQQPSPFFPAVKKLGGFKQRMLYECPFYAKLTPSYATAWATFTLIKAAYAAELKHPNCSTKSLYDGHAFNRCVVNRACEMAAVNPSVPTDAIEALSDLVEWAANFGSEYWLDISRRNFAVNCGQLVYLDLMANAVEVRAANKKR